MIQIFDTHAHYDDESFDDDRERLLAGFPAQGVHAVTNIGTNIRASEETVRMTEKYENLYGVVGIFPSEVAELENPDNVKRLKELAKHDKIVAIGEIGLDYHYEETDKALQHKWFAGQMDIARELKLPIAIHSRDAAQDTLQIMDEHCDWSQGGVIHCFSYTVETAKIYLRKGFYLGIGGVVTFKNGRKLVEVVKEAPLEQLVLETDSPYLTPVPNRGRRNDSRQLTYVVDAIAQIKGIDREEVIRVTEENAKKMYRII